MATATSKPEIDPASEKAMLKLAKLFMGSHTAPVSSGFSPGLPFVEYGIPMLQERNKGLSIDAALRLLLAWKEQGLVFMLDERSLICILTRKGCQELVEMFDDKNLAGMRDFIERLKLAIKYNEAFAE